MSNHLPTHNLRFLVPVEGDLEGIDHPLTIDQIAKRLGAESLDTVSLRDPHGRVMLVDDNGHAKGLPINAIATSYYHAVCRVGSNPPPIRGPVIVVPDADFSRRGAL